MNLVIVDTSSWTHALRRIGDPTIQGRVRKLLDSQTAARCEMVRLELWSGVRNDLERRTLEGLDRTLPRMPINNDVWAAAANYGSKARRAGLSIPATDLLIFACAKKYGLEIEHSDRHYELLKQLT